MLTPLKVPNTISIPEMSKKVFDVCGTADLMQLGHKGGQSTVILVCMKAFGSNEEGTK